MNLAGIAARLRGRLGITDARKWTRFGLHDEVDWADSDPIAAALAEAERVTRRRVRRELRAKMRQLHEQGWPAEQLRGLVEVVDCK